MAADEIVCRQRAAAIGHVDDVDTGLLLEQFAGEMMRRSDARRTELQLAGIGLGVGDQLGHGIRRH